MSKDIRDDPEVKRELRRIDGVLPEDIDRRSFFLKSAASVLGLGALAGCTGSGGGGSTATPTSSGNGGGGGSGGGGGDSTSTPMSEDDTATPTSSGMSRLAPEQVRFRNFWKPKQGYAFEYMSAIDAEGKPSFFNEEVNIKPPQMSAGVNDAAQYTGTGQAELGLSSWSITVNGLSNDWSSVTFGMSNPKSFVGLIYDTSAISDPTEDLRGASVAHTGNLMEVTWPLYADAVGTSQDELGNWSFVEENVVGAFLRQQRVDAVWTTINDFPAFQTVANEAGVDIGVDPMYKREPLYGLNLVANGDFAEANPEYMRRYLTGYSMAGKWSLMNPQKVLDIFRQQIRPELQTVNREDQLKAMKISVFWTNYTEGIRQNGIGYINPDVAETSTQAFADAFGVDASADDFIDYSIQEDADLDSFSSDEWSQFEENGQPYLDLFS
jgi:hypothetical protein